MDVGRPAPIGLQEDLVDELDHRGLLGLPFDVFYFFDGEPRFLDRNSRARPLGRLRKDLADRLRAHPVMDLEHPGDILFAREDRTDLVAQLHADFVFYPDIEGGGHGDRQDPLVKGERKELVVRGDLNGDTLEDVLIDARVREIDHVQAHRLGE